jgi:hypothetical protein
MIHEYLLRLERSAKKEYRPQRRQGDCTFTTITSSDEPKVVAPCLEKGFPHAANIC